MRRGQIAANRLNRIGDIEAARAERSGQIVGNTIGSLGDIAQRGFAAYGAQQDQQRRSAAIQSAMAAVLQGQAGPDAILAAAGPDDGSKILNGLQAYREVAERKVVNARDTAGRLAAGMKALPPDQRAQLWPHVRQAAIQGGLGDEQTIPAEPTDQYLNAVIGWASGKAPEQAKVGTREITTRDAQGREIIQIVPDTPGQTFTSEPAPPKPDQPIMRVNPRTGKVEQIGTAPAGSHFVNEPAPPRVNLNVNAGTAEDIDTLAQMLAEDRIAPSQLSKRAGSYNTIIARANKIRVQQGLRPLDPQRLETQYKSAQRWASTMNGNQMIRFKGLAESVVNTIDEVRQLADELRQGGVQAFNRAKRNTILQVYGNTAQSELAARYIGAVNTLKEEFANLAQGGFAPTEAAWKLANDQINADFGVRDLNAALSEVQRLINFRVQAFDAIQPVSPYGGSPAAAPAPRVYYDANGNPIKR